MASVQLLTTPPCLPCRPSRRDWVDPFDRNRLSPTPHQAHELAWRRLDARRRGSRCSRGRGCKLRTARARRRPGAPRNGRTEDTKGGRYLKYRPTPGSSHPSDRSSAVKIRSTGVILVRHLFALLGGERLPTMARARPRVFRCSRTHSCPRRALDERCSMASWNRRRDRQDITQAQNLHAWAR